MTPAPDFQKHVTIILGPILALLRSRKFVASVAAILVSLVIAHAPGLAPYADMLILGILVLAAVLSGAIAHEDAAETKAKATEAAGRTQAENLQAAIEAALETFYTKQAEQGALLTAQAAEIEFTPPTAQEVADLIVTRLVETDLTLKPPVRPTVDFGSTTG